MRAVLRGVGVREQSAQLPAQALDAGAAGQPRVVEQQREPGAGGAQHGLVGPALGRRGQPRWAHALAHLQPAAVPPRRAALGEARLAGRGHAHLVLGAGERAGERGAGQVRQVRGQAVVQAAPHASAPHLGVVALAHVAAVRPGGVVRQVLALPQAHAAHERQLLNCGRQRDIPYSKENRLPRQKELLTND